MIDTHTHLDFDQFDADRDAVIQIALNEGVELIINIGTDFSSSQKSIELAEKYPQVFAAVGIHPHDAKTWNSRTDPARLEKLAAHPHVVAIGEIGLDFYRNYSPHEDQRRAFADQIAVARNLHLPLVVHNREAFNDTFDMLLDCRAHEVGGVMHCFAGTPEQGWQTVDYGFLLSVGGRLTYTNSGDPAVAEAVPLDKILLETDCPFLTPMPFRGKRNHPALIKHVRAKLAEIKRVTEAEVDRVTTAAARKVFRLDEKTPDR
jgi:TatD DNase family protein